jgi:hypothetical protein
MPRKLSILLLVIVVGVLVVAWMRRTGGLDAVAVPKSDAAHADTEPVEVAATPGDATERVEAAPNPEKQPATVAAQDPSLAHLIVHVVGKSGRAPLANVRVMLFRKDPSRDVSEGGTPVKGTKGDAHSGPITAAEGLVEFELPPATEFQLRAHGEDGKSGRANDIDVPGLRAGERRELVIELGTGNDQHYFGRLLAREDRGPIAGGRVEVSSVESSYSVDSGGELAHDSKCTPLSASVTDADGRFELHVPSWQALDVRVRAQGFSEAILATSGEHDTPEKAKEILLARCATLRARILDSRGGPLADAAVRLWTQSYNLGVSDHGEVYLPSVGTREWRKEADALGVCAFEGLPADVPFHVAILRAAKVARKDLPDIALNAGEVREVEWTIGSGCRIEGRVTDQQGEVVKGHAIWMERASFDAPRVFERIHVDQVIVAETTDAEGRFRFQDVGPGKWWIGPAATLHYWDAPDDHVIAPFAQVLDVQEGTAQQQVDLRVHRGLYIRGKVLKSSGEIAPKVFLSGHANTSGWPLAAEAREDGSFALGPLVPGRYAIVADGAFSDDADSAPVEAEAGQSDVVVQLRAGGSISGVVNDLAGKGCRAQITFALRKETSGGWSAVHSDEDGSFKLRGLSPGTYDIAVRGPGDGIAIQRGVEVQAGIDTGDHVLKLAPGARLHVRYAGKDGYLNYSVMSAGVIVSGDGIKAGGTSETSVPTGPIVVEAEWPPAAKESRELDIPAGQEKELVFGGK